MSSICFLCHFCGRPLKLTRSEQTSGLDFSQEPAALNSPSAQGGPGDTPETSSASSLETDGEELRGSASGRAVPGCRERCPDSSCNFTLLGKPASERTLSSIQRATTGLWDVLSGEGPEQPLCEDCTDSLLERLDSQLRTSEADCQAYRRCLETRAGSGEDAEETLQQQLKALELEEAGLGQALKELDKARERTAAALQAAQSETEALEQRERRWHRDLGELQWQQLELQDELGSLEARLRHAQSQLAWLERTSAFKAAFEIGCEGPIATINSCRLGCAPTVPVSWGEISAAWGHTALLLAALANALGLQFQRFQLVPLGDHSFLRPLTGDPGELPLFCTGGRSAEVDSRFDRAMAAFLDCMQQLNEEAQKAEPGLFMPYSIHPEQGLMGDPGSGELHSIRTRRNTEERWTKALKFMLTNFKWSLDWVSLRYRHN